MSDFKKEEATTLKFVAVALVALVLGFSRSESKVAGETKDIQDSGYFYPELNDSIDKVKGIEVTSHNDKLGTMQTFKVLFKDGKWVLPSHYDYPADAVEQVAKVAGSLFDLKKNRVVSDQVKDHEDLKLLDPTDPDTTSLSGLGIRVNLLDEAGGQLAAFIFGKEIPDRNGFRYVRIPGQKRSYGVVVEKVDLSTNFSDWIETDLLKVFRADFSQVTIENYEVDKVKGSLNRKGSLILNKEEGDWKLDGMAKDEELTEKMDGLEEALDSLVITGVRPKPAGLKKMLSSASKDNRITREEAMSLQSKGFYITQQGLYSNVGEVHVGTKKGVFYRLFFGELAYDAKTKQELKKDKKDDKDKKDQKPGEDKDVEANRYFMILVSVNEDLLGGRPVKAKMDGLSDKEKKEKQAQYEAKLAQFETKLKEAKKTVKELKDRFASWYYLISNDKFKNIRLSRQDLVKKKEPEKKDPKAGPLVPRKPGQLPPGQGLPGAGN